MRVSQAQNFVPGPLDQRIDGLSQRALLHASPQSLVDPQRQSAAIARERLVLPGRIAEYFLAAGALLWFWRSGTAARMRDGIRRALRREWLVRILFSMAAASLVRCAELPAQFFLYRVDRIMDLSSTLTWQWFAQWLMGTADWMLAAAFVVTMILWLAERSHIWYIPALLGVVVAILAGSMAAGVLRVPQTPTRSLAYVVGLGPTLHVVVPAELKRVATPLEFRFVMARVAVEREMHVAAKKTILLIVLVIITMAASVGIADRITFRRDDDPLTRVLVATAIIALLALPAHMLFENYARADTLRIDTVALRQSGDLAEAVRALVRQADRDLDPLSLSLIDLAFAGENPPIAERISNLRGSI